MIPARDMFQTTEIIFVSASPHLLEAAKSEGFHTIDPAKEAVASVKVEE
jgi:methionine salvage enolase-phosphatase E1